MEKTFFDYYLLEDHAKILEFKHFHKISVLNTLEKCLLIDVLACSENKDDKV